MTVSGSMFPQPCGTRMHNGPATAPEPCTRRCKACRYRFIPDSPDDRFCSGICAGNPPVTTLLVQARRLAAARGASSG
jgi:hypothetical protein